MKIRGIVKGTELKDGKVITGISTADSRWSWKPQDVSAQFYIEGQPFPVGTHLIISIEELP